MTERRIQVMKLADGGWGWRTVDETGRVVHEYSEARLTRRSALRAARKQLRYWERVRAERWEDA